MYKCHEQEENSEKGERKRIMHQFTFKIHIYKTCINMHLKTNTDYISLVKEFTLEIVLICVEQKA